MRKFLTIFILLVLVGGGIFVYFRYFWVWGEGVKTGQLNYVMYKGYLFKTYEGKLIQSGLQAGNTGVRSNEFQFSVENKQVAEKLMMNSGKEFTLHYKEYTGTLPWRGMTVYIVDSVVSMQEAHNGTTPFIQ